MKVPIGLAAEAPCRYTPGTSALNCPVVLHRRCPDSKVKVDNERRGDWQHVQHVQTLSRINKKKQQKPKTLVNSSVAQLFHRDRVFGSAQTQI